MIMLQADEVLALRGSVEADCHSVQVNCPSQGVILDVLAGVELAGSDKGMPSMSHSVSTAHAPSKHAMGVHCRVDNYMNHMHARP